MSNTQTDVRLEQTNKLLEIKIVTPTILASFGVIFCCCFLSYLSMVTRESPDNTSIDSQVIIDQPIATQTIAPTNTPKFLDVEYQLEVNNVARAATVQYWVTKGTSGENRVDSQLISSGKPYSITIQVAPGEQVELVGAIANNQAGELTCRILIDGMIVEQSTKQGSGAGVYCSGLIPKE